MQIKLLALLPILGLAHASFELPANLPDGAYQLDYDQDNNTVITDMATGKTSLVEARSAENSAHIAKRDAGCTPGRYNHNDYLTSVSRLKSYCDQGNQVISRATVWSVGDAKVYICNYGGSQGCSGHEWDDFNSQMDRNCGDWVGAWVYISDWKKTYGRDNAARGIC